MHIVLTAATNAEIQPTLDWLGAHPLPVSVQPLFSGIGVMATSYALTRAIVHKTPQLMIQAGIAGSFVAGNAGKVMAIEQDVLADLGVWEDGSFKSIYNLKLADADAFPFSAGTLVNPWQQLLSLTGLEKAKAITVNEISTRSEAVKWHQQKFAPVVESMEGAAFHYVCLRENIPFVQLRSISNPIGVRDKSQWNIPAAIRNLNNALQHLLTELSSKDETYFRI